MEPLAQLLLWYQEQGQKFGDVSADNEGRFPGAQQQPLKIVLFFEYVQRLTEAGYGCGIELVHRAGSIEHQFGNAIFQPVEVQVVAFVEHVSLLNPAM